MNQRTLKKLEYLKILETASKFAVSEAGKKKILSIHPLTNEKKVRESLNQLDEVCQFLSNTGSNPINYFRDVKTYLEKTKIGGVLRPNELLEVEDVCEAAVNAKNSILESKIIGSLPFMKDVAENIYKCQKIIDDVKRSITSDSEVADGASTELREIRRELQRQNQNVKESLERIIRSQNNQKYLQEAVITERNGRYVIPVKSEFRGMIQGIIHDQSQTGSTVFIEPISVVQAENEINRLISEEKHEIERILAELSKEINASAADISDNQDTLEQLDVLFAKAGFANKYDCNKPIIRENLEISIVKGRHPLIPREKVVPIDVEIGKSFKTLIITGPNTGGKTVSLKTVGLFILLGQSGFFLPANHVEMGVFNDVLCDIGDEQAIEQNLSTFSSHMTNIIYILNNAKSKSIVLFDELCTGTDPVEGSALARSILSELNGRDILTFATTHYSELKTFAFETEGMENASMEFDIDTLQPTYRLVVGIPGKSNALQISRKLGLDENVIKGAEETMNRDELNVNRLIADIEYNKVIAEKEKKEAEDKLREAEAIRKSYEDKLLQISDRKQSEIEKAKEQASRIIAEAEEEAREIIKDLRFNTDGLGGREKNELIEAARKRLSDKKKEYEKAEKKKKLSGLKAGDLKPGMTVFINSIGTTGTILEVTNADEVLLQAGIIKMKAKIADLERTDKEEVTVKPKEHKKIELKAAGISSTLDLRGKTAEDAYIEIDRYFDSAIMSGLNDVTILHGKGTGALRAAVHEYLRKHPHCESYRIGKYGEGDTGVTIVTLK